MRPSKKFNPEQGVTGKKTYYQTRGKIHLLNPAGFNDVATITWCGLGLDNVNNSTLDMAECTCQRCLMHKTRTWGGKDRGKCGGDVTALMTSERKLKELRKK